MKPHHIADNALTLLRCGEEYFPQLLADIAVAQHAIYLESYIFAPDSTGRLVWQALVQAAQRGVEVRVLLDGFGAVDFPLTWRAELQAVGGEMRWFRRMRWWHHQHRLHRLHRKLVAIDHEVAFVGGINILDDVPPGYAAPRLDFAVRIQGSLAREVRFGMRRLWRRVVWQALRAARHLRRVPPYRPRPERPLALLLRDNLRHRRDIERAYLYALLHAQSEILLANAYFLPGRTFRRVLKQAARRGVRVVLLLQGRVEYRLQHYATHALYDELLAAGVEIYEYQASYLHAKVAVVDGHWATVGSSNIDPFSLLLAREANVLVQDEGFAAELRRSLQTALQQSRPVSAGQPKPLWARWRARASYALLRLVMGIFGFGRF